MIDGLVELEGHQVEKSTFPHGCPVYIYDDQVPACCVGQGFVSRVMLQCVPKVEMFVGVNDGTTEKISKSDNIRFRNGCPVYVKIRNQESGIEDDRVEGVVLGICDIPPDLSRTQMFTEDRFWYSVQLCTRSIIQDGSTLHEVSPADVSYRHEDESDESDQEKQKQKQKNMSIKIKKENENDPSNSLETVSIDSDEKMIESNISSTEDSYQTNHYGNSQSTKIEEEHVNGTFFTKEKRDIKVRESNIDILPALQPRQSEESHIVVENSKVVKSVTPQSDVSEHSWRYIQPGPSDALSRDLYGRTFYWCGKCNAGKGMWSNHYKEKHDLWDKSNDQITQSDNICHLATLPMNETSRNGKRSPSPCESSTNELRNPRNLTEIQPNLRVENRYGGTKDQNSSLRNYPTNNQKSSLSNSLRSTILRTPPESANINTKIIEGKTYYWCGKCRGGNGYWTNHSESNHVDKIKRRRLSGEVISVNRGYVSNENQKSSTKTRQQVNEHYNSSLFRSIYNEKGSLKLLLDQDDVPTSFWNKKAKMCIYYHVKGSCREGCPNSADHDDVPKEKLNAFYRWCHQKVFNTFHQDVLPNTSNQSGVFKCMLRLPVETYHAAKEILIGKGGCCHKDIEKVTRCKVHYRNSGLIIVKHEESKRAENGAKHILKRLRCAYGESANISSLKVSHPEYCREGTK